MALRLFQFMRHLTIILILISTLDLRILCTTGSSKPTNVVSSSSTTKPASPGVQLSTNTSKKVTTTSSTVSPSSKVPVVVKPVSEVEFYAVTTQQLKPKLNVSGTSFNVPNSTKEGGAGVGIQGGPDVLSRDKGDSRGGGASGVSTSICRFHHLVVSVLVLVCVTAFF